MMDSPTTILTSVSTQTSLYADTSPPKRKRRPAGTPDPDAEVIALSPKTLMESDRYTCEICNQGFQRDQNLQMHRRRHKVPWKLLKRVDLEVRKRVYVCPEPSCLHHDPCHALGDLVGIKKHYRRKHSSMKQWECDKCSKAYAVQSDYKAHLKTCGTRGHCCDCGRVFSRVESFIEHQDTCTAARNKKGSASSELEPASLPSLAVPSTYHAPIMLTHPSNFTEKAMKDSHLHQYGAASINIPLSPLHLNRQDRNNPLPSRSSSSPASPASAPAMNAHACIAIPSATAPPPPCPNPALPVIAVMLPRHSLHSAAPSTCLQATPDVGISWETQQPCILQPHNTELQLLPTSKAHLNQLESSQSSVTWGRDITSTNSTTSGTCSSPASKIVDDKCMHKGADCDAEMLPLSSVSFTAAAAPCKLQLSIGLSNPDQFTYCGKSTSLHVSRDLANQGNNTKQVIDSKATSTPWLAWSTACPLNVIDAYHDVPNIGVAKGHSSLRASYSGTEKLGMTCRADAYEGATDLELATGFGHHCSSVRFNQPGVEEVHHLQQREDLLLSCSKTTAAEFSDQNCTKPSHIMEDEDLIEVSQAPQRSCKQLFDSTGACEEPKLLQCNSERESIVALDVSNQPQTQLPNSLSVSNQPQTQADQLSELLQFAEILNFSRGTSVSHEKLSFSLGPEIHTTSEVAEVLLQKAREKLRRASEEKLEAEKAWREARREREQAEEELAKAQRIADYNRVVARGKGPLMEKQEEGTATRKANGSSSTSSSPCNSIANSQASSSSLQIMHAAGGVLCSAPSFITCPTCHHTQILYPSPNNMGTLFLASPVDLNAPASTLTSTPHIKVPSSPTHFS